MFLRDAFDQASLRVSERIDLCNELFELRVPPGVLLVGETKPWTCGVGLEGGEICLGRREGRPVAGCSNRGMEGLRTLLAGRLFLSWRSLERSRDLRFREIVLPVRKERPR